MRIGFVKSYGARAGFGFIVDDETGEDIFFHATRCYVPETRLFRGLKVPYELIQGNRPGKMMADNVRLEAEAVE